MRIHDGAYGTLLDGQLRGDETVDDLCLRDPRAVVDAHRAYLDAGATAIQTNSFLVHLRGSSRRRAELRRAALECAREAAAAAPVAPPLVSMTIGPIGDEPRAYWESIEHALESEAQALLCETITTRAIADAVLAAWSDVAAGVRDVELLLACSTDPADATASRWVVDLAGEAPDAVLLGLNCCTGPEGVGGLLAQVVEQRGTSWTMPSAGIPAGSPPRWPWSDPSAWAARVREEVADIPLAGLGGCCGTGPDHVAALEVPSES